MKVGVVFVVVQDDRGDVTIGPVFTSQAAAKAWVEVEAYAAFADDPRQTKWVFEERALFLFDTERFIWYWSIEERVVHNAE